MDFLIGILIGIFISTAASSVCFGVGLVVFFKTKWLNRIDLNSETSFEDQVKGFETEYSELQQTIVDSTPLSGSIPISTGANGKASDAEIDSIVSDFKI